MIKTLTQIVATILTIGVGFVAAYVIYLFSYQSNIDEKISTEGHKIAAELLKARISGFPFTFFPENSLLNKYRELYPKKTKVFILNSIANDLYSMYVWPHAGARAGLADFESPDKRHAYLSGIFMALLRQYVIHLTAVSNEYILFPAGGAHVRSNTEADFYLNSHATERFPLGMIGARRWSDEFLLINNSTRLMDERPDIHFEDYKKFVDSIEEAELHEVWKKEYEKFDLEAWYAGLREIFSIIETSNYRIQTLLKLKESYSFSNHLPSFTWVLYCTIISFLLGVLLPLVMMGLNHENTIPSPFNFIVLLATFLFMSGGVYFLGRDISSTSKLDFKARYVVPLTEQFSKDEKDVEKVVTFDYDIVNQTISEQEESKLSSELEELLSEYQDAVIETNRHSKELAAMLTDSVRKSELIGRNSIDPSSGGTGIEALRLLFNEEYKQQFYDTLREKKGGQILGLTFSHIGTRRGIVTIKPPDNDEELALLIAEIDRIIKVLVSAPQYAVCISKRDSLGRRRRVLIDKLNSF